MDYRLENARQQQAMEINNLLTYGYRLEDNFFSFY